LLTTFIISFPLDLTHTSSYKALLLNTNQTQHLPLSV